MWRLGMSQSCFSLGFLSQYSLWKLSTIHGYKRYLYLYVFGMRRVSFFKIELVGDLASRLNWVANSSSEVTKRTDWTFCSVVLQLAWRFNFSVCLAHVQLLAACKPWATREIQSRVPNSLHNFEHFFTLSHTLSLHDSHLNTGLLVAKVQANLAPNKVNKMVDKIQSYMLYPQSSIQSFVVFLILLLSISIFLRGW